MPRYSRSGHIIYTSSDAGGTLFARPFDPDRLEVTGPPVTITEGLSVNTRLMSDFAISSTGSLVYHLGDVEISGDRRGRGRVAAPGRRRGGCRPGADRCHREACHLPGREPRGVRARQRQPDRCLHLQLGGRRGVLPSYVRRGGQYPADLEPGRRSGRVRIHAGGCQVSVREAVGCQRPGAPAPIASHGQGHLGGTVDPRHALGVVSTAPQGGRRSPLLRGTGSGTAPHIPCWRRSSSTSRCRCPRMADGWRTSPTSRVATRSTSDPSPALAASASSRRAAASLPYGGAPPSSISPTETGSRPPSTRIRASRCNRGPVFASADGYRYERLIQLYDVSPDGERILAIRGLERAPARYIFVQNFFQELNRLTAGN